MKSYTLLCVLGGALAFGCGPSHRSTSDSGPYGACRSGNDTDNDCIPDDAEGCNLSVAPDSDLDGIPDWADPDADGDGIGDQLEAGADCRNPRDSDGDNVPDYLDTDSDNDGLNDGMEDRNGDGRLGDCQTPCGDNTQCSARNFETCTSTSGAAAGVCVSADCLNGETSPYQQDTDRDGKPDSAEGTAICNPRTQDNPTGIKPLTFYDSADTRYRGANWRIAREVTDVVAEPILQSPDTVESAYQWDMTSPSVGIAGFLASRPAIGNSALHGANWAIERIENLSGVVNTIVRVSGTNRTSLDGDDIVVNTTLQLDTRLPTTVNALRMLLFPALLDRRSELIGYPTTDWVPQSDTRFIVRFQTSYRANAQQTVFSGGFARLSSYDNRARATFLHLDDMSNGTGLTVSRNGQQDECEQYVATESGQVDIIWVVDESGSVLDDRNRVRDNAEAFFRRATDRGLNFRMGVTDMNDTGPGDQPGIFAARMPSGTGDRWIPCPRPDGQPCELDLFKAGIVDPSGIDAKDSTDEHGLTSARAALLRHLPRSDTDPQMVRTHAKLVVIFVTDEKADELEDQELLMEGNLEPSTTDLEAIDTFMQDYVTLFADNDVTAHLIAEPLPHGDTCSDGGAEHAYGYYTLVNALGGQTGSICQTQLGPTLDAILDAISGEAAPITLSKFPISASITIARDGDLVSRSREVGWSFQAASNTIVFSGLPAFRPDAPSDIVVSYRRWKNQVPVD